MRLLQLSNFLGFYFMEHAQKAMGKIKKKKQPPRRVCRKLNLFIVFKRQQVYYLKPKKVRRSGQEKQFAHKSRRKRRA